MVLMRYFLLMRYREIDCSKGYSYDGFGGKDSILFKIHTSSLPHEHENVVYDNIDMPRFVPKSISVLSQYTEVYIPLDQCLGMGSVSCTVTRN